MLKKTFFCLMLVLVLAIIGCDLGNESLEDDSSVNIIGKSITITGTGNISGELPLIYLFQDEKMGVPSIDAIAFGEGHYSNGSVTFSLIDNVTRKPWTGSGLFQIVFYSKLAGGYYNFDLFMYTEGKTMAEIGFTNGTLWQSNISSLPKYSISSQATTITFNMFAPFWQE